MQTYEDQLNQDTSWALEEGSLHFEARSAVHKTLRDLTKSLDELGIDYAIAGAMAMFLHGYRRFTEDVDVIVTAEGLAAIHDALEGRGYVKPFAASRNLRNATTGVRIDFIVSGQYPGDGSPGHVAFPVPSDVAVELDGFRVVSLPKLIELKLASGQASHRLSDLGDVQRMIEHFQLAMSFVDQLDVSLREAFKQLWRDANKEAGDI